MKTNCWLILGMMIATTAVAQVSTNALPEIPAPAMVAPAAPAVVQTNAVAPAPKKKAPVTHKKKAAAKKISEPASALVAGSATVVSPNLNVRGQAGLKGEVVGHLKSGDTVTVISQINLDKHAADEPAQWAKISLPSGTKVWVDSKFLDATNKVVSVKKLNLRAGPGENYSVLGVIEKGTPVSELAAKGAWSQIETPANAFAFVAAMYLKQEAAPVVEPTPTAPVVVETPIVVPPPTASTVAEAQPVVAQPPTVADAAVAANASSVVDTNTVAPVVDTNPPPPRVVSHEGYVRSSGSLVAPTAYELFDLDSGNAINYLYSTSTNLDISRYDGFQIIVTGEEGISARWADTPVLTIQKIYVVSTNSPPIHRVSSPRASQQHQQRR
ncbi:MAG TPA: SH3 domain-containing protein [Verrucomicrobiae bacterium]